MICIASYTSSAIDDDDNIADNNDNNDDINDNNHNKLHTIMTITLNQKKLQTIPETADKMIQLQDKVTYINTVRYVVDV